MRNVQRPFRATPESPLQPSILLPPQNHEKEKKTRMASEEIRWKRMMFKGSKVYASVDEKGALLIQKGRVDIKYQLDQDMKYAALASSVKEIDEAVLQAIKRKRKKKKELTEEAAQAVPSIDGDPNAVTVFTDGACGGNPGPAGIGIVLQYGHHQKEISRFIGEATNNIAELTAIKIALREIKDPRLPVNLYTDCDYCQKTLSGSWKQKKNRELIEAIKQEMTRFSKLNLIKVRGHKGIAGNEHADQLAQQAVQERKTEK